MAIEEGDALSTRGLVSVKACSDTCDIFADALSTRGYIFIEHSISIITHLHHLFKATAKTLHFTSIAKSLHFKSNKKDLHFTSEE